MPDRRDYNSVLNAAIEDIAEAGYSEERLAYWVRELKAAAERSFLSLAQMEANMRASLAAIYKRATEGSGATKIHPGVARFTFERLQPELRLALQRRQAASRELIKLNREEMIAKEQRRLAGWASSVPPGGAAEVDKRRLKAEIRKPLASLPFTERRVIIDQGHKLVANIHATIAEAGQAIAAEWHDRGHSDKGYDARPAHLARTGQIFLVRDSWAVKAGLIKPGQHGFTDDIEQPAELPYCSCWYRYLYNLGQLPDEMLTVKGRLALAEAKSKLKDI